MAAPTAPLTSSSLVTSAGMTTALRPTASMSDAVSARPSALRATIATSAPASANATAMTWPMPREAPVTNAFLPVSSNRLMGSPQLVVSLLVVSLLVVSLAATSAGSTAVGSGQAAGLTRRTISLSATRV